MENTFIKVMEYNNNLTLNGMATHSSSGNSLFDLFVESGAMRYSEVEKVLLSVYNAWEVDKETALKLLFYTRDIVEGSGERRFFRLATQFLLTHKEDSEKVIDNLVKEENLKLNIIRVDDLVFLANSLLGKSLKRNKKVDKILFFLFRMLKDEEIGGIVAKWMPRKNSQYERVVKYMRANGFIKSYSLYRREIAGKTKVVEQQMSKNEWNEINLEQTPSVALKQYRKAFAKHNILQAYLEKVEAGEAKINAQRLTPFDIVRSFMPSYEEWTNIYFDNEAPPEIDIEIRKLADLQWKNLRELNDLPAEYRALPVIDVSGSMTWNDCIPMSMALGLGLFMAERNPNQAFSDYFITFSNEPQFQKIEGLDIYDKVSNAMRADWRGSTNLEATFELVLNKAKQGKVAAEEMPTHIIIFSDMEFNRCVRTPEDNAWQMINRQYAEAGYTTPVIVFWNVDAKSSNFPVNFDESGALLLSGSSQNAMNIVLKQKYENPIDLMVEAISSDRFKHIKFV
ncbi:DUF2828 family protein [bacterium]|nr:DUF2828 family protein [bacterium]